MFARMSADNDDGHYGFSPHPMREQAWRVQLFLKVLTKRTRWPAPENDAGAFDLLVREHTGAGTEDHLFADVGVVANATWPPTTALASMLLDPETPVCAAITTLRPTRTL